MSTYFDDYDYCWVTGDYEDQCCSLCPYKNSCSGHEDEDEEDD